MGWKRHGLLWLSAIFLTGLAAMKVMAHGWMAPKDAAEIEKVLQGSIVTVSAKDMQAAVVAAKTLAQPGDNVLLAPACASFDMFDNFEHRGDVFIQAVENLSGNVRSNANSEADES